jgi:hypothetical protein
MEVSALLQEKRGYLPKVCAEAVEPVGEAAIHPECARKSKHHQRHQETPSHFAF